MNERSGPFWDGVNGLTPIPPAAATLGFEFVGFDAERATIEVAFAAGREFTNPLGNVLGAFLAAMLYDTVGPALLATLEPHQFQSTLELNTCFLHPVRPGRITGTGRVINREADIAHLDGVLHDANGITVATATAVARIIELDQAAAAV